MSDFDARLGDSLKSVSAAVRAGRAERTIGAHADFRRRLRRRRVTRYASLAATAGVMGVAVTIAATQGTDLFQRDRKAPEPKPPAGTYIRVGEDPVSVSVGQGTVWVASSKGTVTRVDPATERSTGLINVGGEPSDIALGPDKAWFSDSAAGSVRPLDIRSGKYIDDSTAVGSQGHHIDVDVAPQGTVWATSYDSGMLIGIDPGSGEVLSRLPVDQPTELALAPGAIWALVEDGHAVVRLDYDTGEETLRVSVAETEKTDLAVASSGVYIAEAGGTILQIDPGSDAVSAQALVRGTRPELAVGDGVLWVASDTDGTRAELARLRLDDLRPLGKRRTFIGAPTDVAVSDDSVWVSETFRDTVVRLKAASR